MSKKYLAYIALLAGWLIFCYWLYAKEVYPRLHQPKGLKWPVFDKDLSMPLAFKWGSDIPIAGEGFEEWIDTLKNIDTAQNFLIFQGYYFRDEAKSIEKGKELGRKRVERMINYLGLSKERMMFEIIPGDIISDVRSRPFPALTYNVVSMKDVLKITMDTIEVCFPVKDSLSLPKKLFDSLDEWLNQKADKKNETIYLTGTADGTGISESADVAWERADVIKKNVIQHGWNEHSIQINTGQRNQSISIRNRCVLVHFNE